jgi:hypothetical protein
MVKTAKGAGACSSLGVNGRNPMTRGNSPPGPARVDGIAMTVIEVGVVEAGVIVAINDCSAV